MAARLKEHYSKKVAPALTKEFSYTNAMAVPKIEKVVLNMGVGREAQNNPKVFDQATMELSTIAGQKPVITKAKKSIAAFKLRTGMPVGPAKVLDALNAVEAVGLDNSEGNPRLKEVANRLLSDLMVAIDELDISMDEFWAGVGYLGEAAKANELGLVVPGLALEHFLDLRLDEAVGGRPAERLFLNPWPWLPFPWFDRLVVALGCPPLGFLMTPRQAMHQAPDGIGMVVDAELLGHE